MVVDNSNTLYQSDALIIWCIVFVSPLNFLAEDPLQTDDHKKLKSIDVLEMGAGIPSASVVLKSPLGFLGLASTVLKHLF